MRPSTLKRMQILGVYRDVLIGQPTIQSDNQNQVDEAKANIAGVQVNTDPRDLDHELYSATCELDLPEYAPAQFKDKGLALPYKVTIEKESQKVLEVRRNWRRRTRSANLVSTSLTFLICVLLVFIASGCFIYSAIQPRHSLLYGGSSLMPGCLPISLAFYTLRVLADN